MNVFKNLKYSISLLLLFGITAITPVSSEEIGSVKTKFRLLTPNDTISVQAFDDPKIEGITCYLSRAEKGGAASIIGFQEDTADASISCRQMGAIKIKDSFNQGEIVFKKNTSLVFKTMQVVRMFDEKRKAIIYLVYSDRLIDGSPQNSITAVPIQNWNGIDADMRAMEKK